MCKNYLSPISRGMQEEISEYGLECSDAALKVSVSFDSKPVQAVVLQQTGYDAEDQATNNATLVLIWVSFFILIILWAFTLKQWGDFVDAKNKMENKNKIAKSIEEEKNKPAEVPNTEEDCTPRAPAADTV